jgi:hypothetical protein
MQISVWETAVPRATMHLMITRKVAMNSSTAANAQHGLYSQQKRKAN